MTKARDLSKLLSTANGKIAGANLDVSFENISDTGTAGTKVASGTTAQRGSTAGQFRFNSTTGLAEYYTGSEFKIIDSPPTITAVSPLEVDSTAGGNITFTITGSNFQSGAVTKFIGNDATEITASTTTVNSGSSISAVIARSSFVNAKEPYDVRVLNTSGLSGTLDNQINVDSNPTWSTASGQIGGVIEEGDSVSTSVTATDADGDTIVYSVQSGTLPTGLSLNSSTGAITGTAPAVTGDTTSSFTLRATANSKTTDRAFNIIIKEFVIDGSTSARSASSAQSLYNLGITTAGAYYITVNGSPKLTYCDFFNNEGWILVGNLKSNYYTDSNWSWNDYNSWRRSHSSFGSVSAPFSSGTTTQYRDAVAYEHYNGTKVAIKIHNFGTMFGSGSYVCFNLLEAYQNGSWLDFMSLSGGTGGGRQITSAYYAQAGMATGGSANQTTGFATNLDYCPIARAIGSNGHLRANHHLSNNGVRLLTSFQYLETSNTDSTRGLGQAFGIVGGGIEEFEADFNAIVPPFTNATNGADNSTAPFLEEKRQFGTGVFPDNSNLAGAVPNPSGYSGPAYHYALYIK